MLQSKNHWGLYTDFYELTMAQGYYLCGKKHDTSVFDYYFRTNPYKGGFTVFAGLDDFLSLLSSYRFSDEDIGYLERRGFNREFLNYLKSFRFNGNLSGVREGEIVFPNEPLIQVEGNIIECQLIESALLNIINFESLVATKAFRIKQVIGDRSFSDFGLRRAQGLGAVQGSRAAAIGGASSTSNVYTARLYDIPPSGTMAHSWVQSFGSELEAFREFVKTNPKNAILLVDTYDTLKSGMPNAIQVAHEMKQEGTRLLAIRLDSGDLAYLSKKARQMLDDAGLHDVKIVASNQLDEHVIKSLLVDQNACIDFFGVGTELITAKPNAALDGVYKLAETNGDPRMKFSENIEKVTLPGKKNVYRYFDAEGMFYRDAVVLANENPNQIERIHHPVYPQRSTEVKNLKFESLLSPIVRNGNIITRNSNVNNIHQYLVERSRQLPQEHKRFISPHLYKVGISHELMELRNALVKRLKYKQHLI